MEGSLRRPRLPETVHLCVVREGCWLTRDMPKRASITQPNAGALSQFYEEANVWKTARCWKQRLARGTCVPGAPASSLTGQWVQQCMASTNAFTRRGSCCRGLRAMLSGVGEGRTDLRHSMGCFCSCGCDAPSSDRGVLLFVVRHATSIATVVMAKIGYGAGHGARIGSWPASRKAGNPREWARARATQRRLRRERAWLSPLSRETDRQPVEKGPPTEVFNKTFSPRTERRIEQRRVRRARAFGQAVTDTSALPVSGAWSGKREVSPRRATIANPK